LSFNGFSISFTTFTGFYALSPLTPSGFNTIFETETTGFS
jgi:hypothetical protein